MSQRRIQDFGSPVVASSLKSLGNSMTEPGVLDGNDFIVDATNRVRINPGACITDEGVIILEDEAKTLEIVNTSLPVDYTIFYSHTDADISGGIPAILTIDTGLLDDSVVNGVILGYVRYPGGGIPLAQEHFVQTQALKIGGVRYSRTNAPWLVPIRNQGYLSTTTSGGVIDITDTFDISGAKPEMFVKFRNNDTTTGDITITFPFKVNDDPFALLQLVLTTDINVTVTPSFIDSVGTTTALSTPFTNEPTLTLKSVDIGRAAVQTANTLVYVQLGMSIAIGREVNLQSIGLNRFNLPI